MATTVSFSVKCLITTFWRTMGRGAVSSHLYSIKWKQNCILDTILVFSCSGNTSPTRHMCVCLWGERRRRRQKVGFPAFFSPVTLPSDHSVLIFLCSKARLRGCWPWPYSPCFPGCSMESADPTYTPHLSPKLSTSGRKEIHFPALLWSNPRPYPMPTHPEFLNPWVTSIL